jgi:hypothetical protein
VIRGCETTFMLKAEGKIDAQSFLPFSLQPSVFSLNT